MANGTGNVGGFVRFWGVIVAVIGALLWVGRMSNKLDTVALNQQRILNKIEEGYPRADAERDWRRQEIVDEKQDHRIERLEAKH